MAAMSTDVTPELDEPSKWSPWALAAAVLLLAMFAVIGAAMFRGCLFGPSSQQAAETEEDKKKMDEEKEREKKDFDVLFPVVQPAEPEAPLSYAKPGHWATATQTMRANYRDFV